MRACVFDIETDGLLDTVTRIWCATVFDVNTQEFISLDPSDVHRLPSILSQYEMCIGHNIVGFDFTVLKKFYNFEYQGIMFDTLIACRVLWPDMNGGHSLEMWGKRVGIEKPSIDDWSYYDEAKLHRNKEDVKINFKVYERINKYINELIVRNSRITNDSVLKWIFFERRMTENLDQQARNGWYFDIEECYRLIDSLEPQIEETRKMIIPRLPIVMDNKYKVLPVVKPFKKDGTFTSNLLKHVPEEQLDNICGEFCRVQLRPMKLSDYEFMKKYLLSLGWVPSKWNYQTDQYKKPLRDPVTKEKIKTSPKLPKGDEWDIVADLAKNEDLKLIALHNKQVHRRNVLIGWTKAVRGDHRIPAECISASQVTQRCSPMIVVNVPRADGISFLGKEMRGLFKAEEGRILVGCDADSLEARITANFIYPYDRALAMELIEGDLHSKNAVKFKGYNVNTRQDAKNTFYALLYGAQPPSITLSHNIPLTLAKQLYNSFWEEYPAIAQLRDDVIKEYKKNGFLIGIDGRPLTVRYQHAALNTRIQSTGAITMKMAYCLAAKRIKDLKLDCKLIGFFHDETQAESSIEDSQKVVEVLEWAIPQAGRMFKLNVPITGTAKTGYSWAEVH